MPAVEGTLAVEDTSSVSLVCAVVCAVVVAAAVCAAVVMESSAEVLIIVVGGGAIAIAIIEKDFNIKQLSTISYDCLKTTITK